MEQPKKFHANILVAEDDPDDRLLVRQALEGAGFTGTLRFVNDGVELINDLHCSARPDLILLDLHMPRKNGREVLQDIKTDMNLHDITVVAMTGTEMPSDTEICGQFGARYLISKPDTFTEWIEAMSEVLKLLQESK